MLLNYNERQGVLKYPARKNRIISVNPPTDLPILIKLLIYLSDRMSIIVEMSAFVIFENSPTSFSIIIDISYSWDLVNI